MWKYVNLEINNLKMHPAESATNRITKTTIRPRLVPNFKKLHKFNKIRITIFLTIHLIFSIYLISSMYLIRKF